MANGTLKNKKHKKWQPDGTWTFTSTTENETLIEIKNIGTNKFLGGFGSMVAIANETVRGKPHLWKKGHPNNEGYYTLQNSESQKLITADTQSNRLNTFQLKGKY